MLLSPSAELLPAHAMLPSPALVAFAGLLALPGSDIDQVVADAARENPALIVDDARDEPAPFIPPTPVAIVAVDRDRQVGAPMRDPPVATGWREALLRDLRIELPSRDADVALLVIGCLDDQGLLADDPIAVGCVRGYEPDRVDHVLTVLRDVGPPGVGARDARHCLELQLDRLPATDPWRPLARAIVAEHLEALGAGRLASVAAALGVDVASVLHAREYIREHLRPHPCIATDVGSPGSGGYVRPDVAIRSRPSGPSGFDVEVLEQRRFSIRVDPEFRAVARSEHDEHLAELVNRADFFLDRLRERWATLLRIATYVAERQRGYLDEGAAAAVPLTRAAVARALGIHESTVSRAISGKYVQLPTQQTVAFSVFFDRSAGVRSVLGGILAGEPAALTDAQLRDRLEDAGYHVARRTVAKYREALGVLPSTRRA